MSISTWFYEFNQNLKIQNGESISRRYATITRRLNTDFWTTSSDIAHSHYVGSYGRRTATNGISDVDMIFELPSDLYYRFNGYSGNGQSALLQLVKNSMKKTYPNSEVSGDGQVVVAQFDDGITFEVLPVFLNGDDSYTHPDSNNGGDWKITNPKPEIASIKSRNIDCNRNLIPLCRMMRAWRKKWDVPINGLLIDTLVYQFIGNYEYRDKSHTYYDLMCRDFFHSMANQSSEQEYWKAPGSGKSIYGKGLFQNKALACEKLAKEAISHETATPKQEWSAQQKWRDIFGTRFPS